MPQRKGLPGSGLRLKRRAAAWNGLLLSPSVGVAACVASCLGHGGVARAQSVLTPFVASPTSFNTLIVPTMAPDFARDHNVSVLEEAHPDFDAPGAAIGSFMLHPQATLGVVADNNVYASDTNKQSDVSGVFKPSATLVSDWSRHMLELIGSADIRRYATQTRRNQVNWDLYPIGEMELGRHLVLHAEGRVGRYYESPYTNDLSPDAQVLSSFQRQQALLRATYTGERLRLVGSYEHSHYSFARLDFNNGDVTDQSYRNRTIDRYTGQAEYALSPSFAVYSAVSADHTYYPVAQSASNPPQTSNGQTAMGGVSFDLAGVMRGQVGLGYTHRGYLDTAYRNVSALSAQAKVDFFPFQMTTVSLSTQRLIQDSSLSSTPYIDTRVMAEVDQSLRENLTLIFNAALADQSYFSQSGKRIAHLFQGAVRYQASRWLGFQAEVNYRSSRPTQASLGTSSDGVLFGLSMTVRR
ncbi:outer membrane beta-barrel protein [Novosphingobium terrae]|uniref:outer membrane beta-barrel protein n=1 Tax=Novosphingobium terrae TaxID=2726189 RepID=UPI00197F5D19|nr:outer membrane beta-barrel protein [Novosphingobium terrae]